MAEVIISEIERILARLEEIENERSRPSLTDRSRKEELLNEEHRLNRRLAKLQERASKVQSGSARERAGAQTDITHTPRLPEAPEQ